jgi:hypothetical protein
MSEYSGETGKESKERGPDEPPKLVPIGSGRRRGKFAPDVVRGRLNPPSGSKGNPETNIVKSDEAPVHQGIRQGRRSRP